MMEENAITDISKLTILKLGGSAITKKDRLFTPNRNTINRLAKEIAKSNFKPLIIVHGGGSFGHPIAEKYKIYDGYTDASQIIGFSKTHQAMTILNRIVMKSLIAQEIPAIEIQPSSFIITKAGRIHVIEILPIIHLIKLGFIPILYGDSVIDLNSGFTILSGDQLVSTLALKLNANRIILGTDVNGIYTADPKIDPSAKLIHHINLLELKKLKLNKKNVDITDVTGGMLGKITELVPAIEHEIPVIILNALKTNNVYKALNGEDIKSTIIFKGENFDKSNQE